MPRLPIIPQVGVQSPVTQVSAPSMAQAMPQLPAQNVALENATNQWGKTLGSIALQRQDEDNETAVRTFAAAYTEKASRSSAEFHGLIGGEAVSGYDKFVKSLDDERNSIVGKLPNEMQRRMFEKVALDTKSQIVSRATVHREKQRFAEDYGRREARATAMEGAFVEAVRNSDDSPESLLAVKAAGDALRASHLEVAAISQLAGEEARSLFLKSRMAAVHDQVAEALLLANNPEKAAQHLADAEAAGEYNIGGKQGEMGIRLAQWKKTNLGMAARAKLANVADSVLTVSMEADPTKPPDWTELEKVVSEMKTAESWPQEHADFVLKQQKAEINWQVASRLQKQGNLEAARAVMDRAVKAGEFGTPGNVVDLGITAEERARDAQGLAARIDTLMSKVMVGSRTDAIAPASGVGPAELREVDDFVDAETKRSMAEADLFQLSKKLNWHPSVYRQKLDALTRAYHHRIAESFLSQGRPEAALMYLDAQQLRGALPLAGAPSVYDGDTDLTFGGGGMYGRGGSVESRATRALTAKQKEVADALEDAQVAGLTSTLSQLGNGLARTRALNTLAQQMRLPSSVVDKVQTRLNHLEVDESAAEKEAGTGFLTRIQRDLRASRASGMSYQPSPEAVAEAIQYGVQDKLLDLVANQEKLDVTTAEGLRIKMLTPEARAREYPTKSHFHQALIGQLSSSDVDKLLAEYDSGSISTTDIERSLFVHMRRNGMLDFVQDDKRNDTDRLTSESKLRFDGALLEVKNAISNTSPTADTVSKAIQDTLKGGLLIKSPEGSLAAKTARFVWELSDEQLAEFGVPARTDAGIEGPVFTVSQAKSNELNVFEVDGKFHRMSWADATNMALARLTATNSIRVEEGAAPVSRQQLLQQALAEVQSWRAGAVSERDRIAQAAGEVRSAKFVERMKSRVDDPVRAIEERERQLVEAATPYANELGRIVGGAGAKIGAAFGNLADRFAGPAARARQAGYAADEAAKRAAEYAAVGGPELDRILREAPETVAGAVHNLKRIIHMDPRTQRERQADAQSEALRTEVPELARQMQGHFQMRVDPTKEYFQEYIDRRKGMHPVLFQQWHDKSMDGDWSTSYTTREVLFRAAADGKSWANEAWIDALNARKNDVSLTALMTAVYQHTQSEMPPELIPQVLTAVADGAGRTKIANLIKAQGEMGYWRPEEVNLLVDAIYTNAYIPEAAMAAPAAR